VNSRATGSHTPFFPGIQKAVLVGVMPIGRTTATTCAELRGRDRVVIVALEPDANHQLVADDAAEHPAAEQKRETAEHLRLGDAGAGSQTAADPTGERFVVGPGTSGPLSEPWYCDQALAGLACARRMTKAPAAATTTPPTWNTKRCGSASCAPQVT
jgi:hypothetical protein